MNPSTSTPPPCLNDLEIADLIAGRLEGEYRERALRHLVDCEDCYAVYAEAQTLYADLESESASTSKKISTEAPAPELPQPLRFKPRIAILGWLPAIAAGLTVGIALAWLLPSHSEIPSVGAGSWAKLGQLPLPVSTARSLTPIPARDIERGNGGSTRQTAGDFRLGAEWTHLEAAFQSGQIEERRQTAIRLEALLQSQIKVSDLQADLHLDLEMLLKRLAEPAEADDPGNPSALTPRLAERMTKLGYEFDLGRFAEAGRLAAEKGLWEFFEPQGEAARYLREMQALATKSPSDGLAEGLAPKTVSGLQEIAKAWPKSPAATGEPFPEAAKAFTSLILAYDERNQDTQSSVR